MGDVADKLRYLKITKSSIRNRIDPLQTTMKDPQLFRSYSQYLDREVLDDSIIYGIGLISTTGPDVRPVVGTGVEYEEGSTI